MKLIAFGLRLSAGVAVVALLALTWRAQLRTNDKLDTLAAAIAARSQSPTAEQAEPILPKYELAARDLDHPSLPSPYIIEAPDQLQIEVVLLDRKTTKTDRLPVQPISGPFLVRPDGTVGLGVWGSVSVTGLTPDQAGEAIREHLGKSKLAELSADKIAAFVDVLAYNSKKYYVITDGEGLGVGEHVFAFPVTGSETVLDAIAKVDGLTKVAKSKSVRIARKTSHGAMQTLPVDWKAIVEDGVTTTNYQLMPSDRLYITDPNKAPQPIPPELQ